jgi:hypothetical protein
MLVNVLARIQRRLEKVGLTESAAALKAGLSRDGIRNLRRAVRDGKLKSGANMTTIDKLAPVLQTTAAWLIEGRGPEELSEDFLTQTVTIDVPLISWDSVSHLGRSGKLGATPDVSQVVQLAGLDPNGNWIALRINGDAMNLVSPHDSIIVVDRRDRQLVPFKHYVIISENLTLYRRFRPPDIWEPVSTNPKHQALTLIGPNKPIVIGRVKKTFRDL